MRTLFGSILIVFFVILAASCSGADQDIPIDDQKLSLEGTSWVLSTIGKSNPIPGTEVTINFQDGSISGNGGCNSYGGGYAVRDTTIAVSDLFMTEMWCESPEGVSEQESRYLDLLSSAVKVELKDGMLWLTDDGHMSLAFEPLE